MKISHNIPNIKHNPKKINLFARFTSLLTEHFDSHLHYRMRGNFGLKLQNSPKLPRIHARFYCNAMSNANREKGYSDKYEVV